MPFGSLVRHEGNESLFRAIEMSVLSIYTGTPLHVHVEGLRGTGKTSIMRAVRSVVPHIMRIKGCPYNCEPQKPHCPLHRGLAPSEIEQAGIESIPMPFLEISHSAKIGTVVGSIDLARIVDRTKPEAALLPGTIPQANRGIIFVDEINRLAEVAPELADVLLAVMGTKPGRVQIEETGLPVVEMPIHVSVWAASNPDEDPGPLEDVRRQLSDRFDFGINMARPTSISQVVSILKKEPRALEPSADLTTKIVRAALQSVEVPADVMEVVARMYLDFGIESLRAVESLLHGALMNARLAGRGCLAVSDLLAVSPLALRHRVDIASMNQILAHMLSLLEKKEVAAQTSDGGPGNASAKPQSQTPEHQEGHDGRNSADPFARLFSKLRDALSGHGPMSSQQPGRMASSSGAARGSSSVQPGFAREPSDSVGARDSSGHSSIADPMRSPLASPGSDATPIALLSLPELIRGPEDLR